MVLETPRFHHQEVCLGLRLLVPTLETWWLWEEEQNIFKITRQSLVVQLNLDDCKASKTLFFDCIECTSATILLFGP